MAPPAARPSPAVAAPARPRVSADPAADAARVLPAEQAQRRALLHEVRWRRRGLDWRYVAGLVLLVLALHLSLMVAIRLVMQPHPYELPAATSKVTVRLIELPPPAELPPAPVQMPPLVVTGTLTGSANTSAAPPRPERALRQTAPAAPRSDGAEAIVATPTAPRLYNPDGSLRLKLDAPAAPPQRPLDAGIAAGKELLARGHNVVRCKRSRFADGYAPDESLGDGVARKYLSVVGLYNPHSAQKLAERQAEAADACDDAGP